VVSYALSIEIMMHSYSLAHFLQIAWLVDNLVLMRGHAQYLMRGHAQYLMHGLAQYLLRPSIFKHVSHSKLSFL
jgi:hypothetical protein